MRSELKKKVWVWICLLLSLSKLSFVFSSQHHSLSPSPPLCHILAALTTKPLAPSHRFTMFLLLSITWRQHYALQSRFWSLSLSWLSIMSVSLCLTLTQSHANAIVPPSHIFLSFFLSLLVLLCVTLQ